jgi:hypothetical protein
MMNISDDVIAKLEQGSGELSQDDFDSVIAELARLDYTKFVYALVHIEGGEIDWERYTEWLGSDCGLLDEALMNNAS